MSIGTADPVLAPNGKIRPKLKLLGRDGNAFYIIGAAQSAMKRAGWTNEEIKLYINDAESGDYDHLLQVTMKYCNVN